MIVFADKKKKRVTVSDIRNNRVDDKSMHAFFKKAVCSFRSGVFCCFLRFRFF